jgi:cytochrome b involved in lipid metabolism
VILDDMVLEVSRWLDEHPGGRFSIEANIGQDVSKFFYGGYALENESKVAAHTHSNDARKIVNQLVVGVLEEEAPKRQMTITGMDRHANLTASA